MTKTVVEMTINQVLLRPEEKQVLEYLTRVGYDAPIRIQAKFGYTRLKVQSILDQLNRMGFTTNVQKGLWISVKWILNNQKKALRLEKNLQITIPYIKEEIK